VLFAPEIFSLLESAKLDFNAKDKAGDTPLHLAVRSGAPEVFEWLRTHGARLDVTNAAGETPQARQATSK
jgi:ankyrin repeat protein